MKSRLSAKTIELLNSPDSQGGEVVSICLPTKFIRVVVADSTYMLFRVQQFVPQRSVIEAKAPKEARGEWKTLSVHRGTVECESLEPAIKASWDAQKKLIAMLREHTRTQGIIQQ